ncbi:3-deoxy-D-manno-octulosonate 8-phosphate phosphatase KdsC [bacterium HR10]|nr:3-deoxy-D-manno-octulosonate 8-phosphate phosphatase KdsC [bacterium HR10]
MDEEVRRRAQAIRVVLMDCDGVLTDGRIVLLPEGEDVKLFDAHDGQGLKLAARAGLRTGVITIRHSRTLERRVAEVSVHHLYQGVERKLEAYERILREEGARDEEVAYIGDDLPDLPPMRRAGLAVAVANAVDDVKRVAHYVTQREGGRGAVRETIELILKAQGKWEIVLAEYLAEGAAQKAWEADDRT